MNRFPLLTEEEEMRLARQLRDDNEDLDAAQQLVLSHLRLVVSIARGYLGYGLPHADLIQEGNIGLMKAVKRFDPERGVRLVSFAMHWIKAEIHEYILRNWRMVKVATTKAQRKLFFNLRSMKKGHGALTPRRDRGDGEARCGVKPRKSRDGDAPRRQDVALEPLGDDDEESFAPIAYLADAEDEPGRVLEHEETERLRTRGLAQRAGAASTRAAAASSRRAGCARRTPLTLHDLAAEFGVSAERIRQIEAKAMKKMRGARSPAAALHNSQTAARTQTPPSGGVVCFRTGSAATSSDSLLSAAAAMSCAKHVRRPAVAREQPQPPCGSKTNGPARVVQRVAAGSRRDLLLENTLNSFAAARGCFRRPAQSPRKRGIEAGDVLLQHLGRVALGVHRHEQHLHASPSAPELSSSPRPARPSSSGRRPGTACSRRTRPPTLPLKVGERARLAVVIGQLRARCRSRRR